MTRVNKKYIDKELKNAAWERFSKTLNKSGSREEFTDNIKKFFTPTEIIMLEKRLAVLVLLERGLSYREIGQTIDVSSNTISSIKNSFMKKPVVQKKYVSSLTKKKRELPLLPPRVGYGKWYYEKRK